MDNPCPEQGTAPAQRLVKVGQHLLGRLACRGELVEERARWKSSTLVTRLVSGSARRLPQPVRLLNASAILAM